MLSRAFLSGQQSRIIVALGSRATTTSAANNAVAKADEGKGPLWGRPVRQEPGKVRLGFVPEEWFTFFYKKTGVTGPYAFAFTLGTYLVSKEIYVLEHEYYSGLSLLVMWIVAVKKLGPKLAAYLDKEIDAYEADWKSGRIEEQQGLETLINHEQKLQVSCEGQNMLVQAKRDNVALQLEAAYRARLMNTFSEIKNRLEYQVQKQNIERRISQKNLVDYVIAKVQASITPDQEKQNIDKCIADLALLAKA